MDIEISSRGVHTIVNLNGDFDYYNIDKIRKPIYDLVKEKKISIIFDLLNVRNIDSSAIGLLFTLYKKVKAYNGSVGVVNINDDAYDLLKIATLDMLIDIYNSVDEIK
jgi:anti-sigma B factor antagonist